MSQNNKDNKNKEPKWSEFDSIQDQTKKILEEHAADLKKNAKNKDLEEEIKKAHEKILKQAKLLVAHQVVIKANQKALNDLKPLSDAFKSLGISLPIIEKPSNQNTPRPVTKSNPVVKLKDRIKKSVDIVIQDASLVISALLNNDNPLAKKAFATLKKDIQNIQKELPKNTIASVKMQISNDPEMDEVTRDINNAITSLFNNDERSANAYFQKLELDAKKITPPQGTQNNNPTLIKQEEAPLYNAIGASIELLVQTIFREQDKESEAAFYMLRENVNNLLKIPSRVKRVAFPINLGDEKGFKPLNEDMNLLMQALFEQNDEDAITAFGMLVEDTRKLNKYLKSQIKSTATTRGNGASAQFTVKKAKTKLSDVAGLENILPEVTEIIEMMKDKEKFTKNGAEIPKGVLLDGAPGVGKTMLAKAMSNEAGYPMIPVSGSEFVEKYVGVGAARIRELFKEARKQAKEHGGCIIFIDEFDALGKKRGSGSSSNSEADQTLNQLLTEMDGFNDSENITVIATTNRQDLLDTAVISRFDRKIHVPLPHLKARKKIAMVHAKNKNLKNKPQAVRTIAENTFGGSGRDIEKLLNEAAIKATLDNNGLITQEHITNAIAKNMMGVAGDMPENQKSKESTAYHEAGHALVLSLLEKHTSLKIQGATILPRGNALGYIHYAPEDDEVKEYKLGYLAGVYTSLAGRAAEEVIFGKAHVAAGASADLKSATKKTYLMATEWAMFPEDFGMGSFGDIFNKASSNPAYQEKITIFVEKKLKEMMDETIKILKENPEALDKLAQALVDKETLTTPEIKKALGTLKGEPKVFIEGDADKGRGSKITHKKTNNGPEELTPATC